MPPTAEIRLTASDTLPAVCIACGAPATEWKERAFEIATDESLGEGEPAPIALVKMVLWFIAVYSRPSVRLRLPWCAAHRQYWLWRTLVYRSCLLAGFIAFVASFGFFNAVGMVLFWCIVIVLVCAAWMVGALMLYRSSVRPVEVKPDSVTLNGVAAQFSEALKPSR